MPVTVNSTPPPPKGMSNVSSAGGTAKRSTPKVTQEREELVAQLGMFAQVPLIATRQFADAGAIALHWPGVAKEVARLAETQEPIARLIDPLLQVGPYAGLIAAVLPLAMQLAVNHGRIKPGSMGTVPAVSLSSQVETAMAQQELASMRAQLDAEREANQAKEDIQAARREMQAADGGPSL